MTEETVTIKVLADTSAFSKEMKNASKQTNAFTQATKKQSQETAKGWKSFGRTFGGGFKATFGNMASSMGSMASAVTASFGKVSQGLGKAVGAATKGVTAATAGAVTAIVGIIIIVVTALIKSLIQASGKFTKMFDPAMYEQQMNKVNASVQKVSTTLGAILMPVFKGLTDYVTFLFDKFNDILEGVLTAYGYIVGILGLTDAISRNATDYAEAMEDASAVANEGLAAFDKLNTFNTSGMGNEQQAQRIRDIMADAASNGADLRESLAMTLDPMRLLGNFFASLNLTEPWLKFVDAGQSAWSRIVSIASGAWESITESYRIAWTFISDTATSVWTSVTGFMGEALGHVFDKFRENIATVANAVLTTYTALFEFIGGDFGEQVEKAFTGLRTALVGFLAIATSVISDTITSTVENYVTVWSNVFHTVTGLAEGATNTLKSIWLAVFDAIGNAWDWYTDYLTTTWKAIINGISGAWSSAMSDIATVLETYKSTILGIATAIQKAFTDVADKVGNVFGGIFDNVGNALLSGFVRVLGSLTNYLNTFIDTYNNTLGNLNINGVGFGKIDRLDVPHLANGGVARPNDPFLAILGDNKSEDEVVAPKSVIEDAVRNVMGTSSGQPIQVEVVLDGRKIARAMFDYLDGEAKRRGTGIGWQR